MNHKATRPVGSVATQLQTIKADIAKLQAYFDPTAKTHSFQPPITAETRSLKNQASIQKALKLVTDLQKRQLFIIKELTQERLTRLENWARVIERIEAVERDVGVDDG